MAKPISADFIKELQSGIVKRLRAYVEEHDTLNMELRGNRVQVFYRGEIILKVHEIGYSLIPLNEKYRSDDLMIPSPVDIQEYMPLAMNAIDVYIEQDQNHLEKQNRLQEIVRANNYSENSLDTDYFVIDMRHQEQKLSFDLIALRWSAKSTDKPVISLIKVLENCKTKKSQDKLLSYINKTNDFVSKEENTERVTALKEKMLGVFQQKRELGLVRNLGPDCGIGKLNELADEIEVAFVLTNQNSTCETLSHFVNTLSEEEYIHIKPKFIRLESDNYGLYTRNQVSME